MNPIDRPDSAQLVTAIDLTDDPYMSGLDPLFHTYVNVLVSTIHKLLPCRDNGQGEIFPIRYFRFCEAQSPRPVRLVMIGGIIVSTLTFNKVRYFHYA